MRLCRTRSALAIATLLASSFPVRAGTTVDLSSESVPTVVGTSQDGEFGYAGDSGDLDGDGSIELVVGAPGHVPGDGGRSGGVVYVFDRRTVAALDAPGEAAALARVSIFGTHSGERFGETLLVADVDGDSMADLVVGAPSWAPDGQVAAGRVCIFLGPLNDGPALKASDADFTLRGEEPGDHFGSSMAFGDVDGDGAGELLISAFRGGPPRAPGAGSVYVVTPGAMRTAYDGADVGEIASCVVSGNRRGDALRGLAFLESGEGTLLALGAYHADGGATGGVDAGTVAIVPAASLASARRCSVGELSAGIIIGPKPRALLGRWISAGDVDDDGLADLLLSAHASRAENRKADAAGEVFVVFGEADGFPDAMHLAEDPALSLRGRGRWDLFGLPSLLADLNGDGASDIVVASQFADSPEGGRRRCGEVHVFRGGLRSVLAAKAAEPDLADVIIVGRASGDGLGGCLFTAPGEGRLLDLIVGAPDAGRPGAVRSGAIHMVAGGLLAGR